MSRGVHENKFYIVVYISSDNSSDIYDSYFSNFWLTKIGDKSD